MQKTFRNTLLLGLAWTSAVIGSTSAESTIEKTAPAFPRGRVDIQLVAYFPNQQATGVAISKSGRIFLSLPRLTSDVPISVGELVDGKIVAYPNPEWNAFRNSRASDNVPESEFVCAQAVVMDHHDHLWVVDPATPGGKGRTVGQAKLVEIDVQSDRILRTLPFDVGTTPPSSSINDVRFSPDDQFAYLSDVGQPGSLIVMNLKKGDSWRVLSGHPSTQYDPTVTTTFKGKPLVSRDGKPFHLNVDGIEISPDGRTFYWQAFTGKTVYSLSTAVLQDPKLAAGAKPQSVATTHAADGLWIDAAGRFYVTNPGENSIEVADQVGKPLSILVKDNRMHWPDSFAQASDGSLYVSASFIADSPWFNAKATTTPSAIFRIRPHEAAVIPH